MKPAPLPKGSFCAPPYTPSVAVADCSEGDGIETRRRCVARYADARWLPLIGVWAVGDNISKWEEALRAHTRVDF